MQTSRPSPTRGCTGRIWNAQGRDHTKLAARGFATDYGVNRLRVAAKITDDLDLLLEFYDHPAEH